MKHHRLARHFEGSEIHSESARTLRFLSHLNEIQHHARISNNHEEYSDDLARISEDGGVLWALDTSQLREALEYFERVKNPPVLNPRALQSLMEVRIITRVDEIHGGFLESFERYWICIPDRDKVILQFILKIGGERDYLEAENHNLRHYHYCNWRGKRTDVILTFDVENIQNKPIPLFWEKHGEGKSHGQAKANAWKQRKRQSIYAAVSPDLAKIPRTPFRRPSNGAGNVWPLGVDVSPRS